MNPKHGASAENAPLQAFGGRYGAFLMMVFMPAVSVYLFLCVHRYQGGLAPFASVLREAPLPTFRATGYFAAWLAFQFSLDRLIPGKVRLGLPQADGSRFAYRLNGPWSLGISVFCLAALFATGALPPAALWDELGPLLAVSTLATFALSAFLYLYGLRSSVPEQRTGDVLSDFFLGTARNPRVGDFDLKFFFESKIGMTTWIAVTLGAVPAALARHGTLPLPLLLVVAFQLLYVVDFYWFEEAMLTTWDINHENFGFMLAFGFLVWMPFNFSLQARYLVNHQPAIGVPMLVGITALNLVGYVVFRTSNLQKHRFRADPEAPFWGKKPSYISTAQGGKLLTSGWWGLARHANYFGDFTMALAWSLVTGVSHVVPYFYVLYFAPLLIHRERRDHHTCRKKYGADWDEYCRRVRYRIIPGVY